MSVSTLYETGFGAKLEKKEKEKRNYTFKDFTNWRFVFLISVSDQHRIG